MYIAGASLVRRAVDMLRAGGCDPVLVVLPPAMDPPEDVIEDQVVSFVSGGPTRQESVANAVRLVKSKRVVVHDAARPLAEVSLLERALVDLATADGVIPAVPVDETIKRVNDNGTLETVDRAGLWRAQTPSAFVTAVLRRAHERAADEGFIGTDEGQLLERFGGRVVVVSGSRTNIKVTYPEDVELVETLLGGHG
jgi:2-C-methyl-D-erythritol 4-phosphate cytidylyltransferase